LVDGANSITLRRAAANRFCLLVAEEKTSFSYTIATGRRSLSYLRVVKSRDAPVRAHDRWQSTCGC
jgi:hypothetical protein